jgi:hypothetical protein
MNLKSSTRLLLYRAEDFSGEPDLRLFLRPKMAV